MKLKNSVIIGLVTTLAGFIPMSFNKEHNITFKIFTNNIVNANSIKADVIEFYKQYCFASSFKKIDQKIKDNLALLKYDAIYTNYEISIFYDEEKIKMIGFLYQTSPSFIDFKYYFNGVTNSIPEATSTSAETLILSDQIW